MYCLHSGSLPSSIIIIPPFLNTSRYIPSIGLTAIEDFKMSFVMLEYNTLRVCISVASEIGMLTVQAKFGSRITAPLLINFRSVSILLFYFLKAPGVS